MRFRRIELDDLIMVMLGAGMIFSMVAVATLAAALLVVGLMAWPLLLAGASAWWLIDAARFAWRQLFHEADQNVDRPT